MCELGDPRSEWENDLRRSKNLTREDLAELQSHIDDSIQELVGLGLSREEATILALRRVGDPTALASEFTKVGPGDTLRDRLYWAAVGLVGFSIAVGVVRLLSHLGTWMALGGGSEKTWFMGLGMTGLGFLFLSVIRAARAPYGRMARTLHWMLEWAQRRPLRSAHLAFSALAGLTILDHFATGFVWRLTWPDGYAAIGALEAMVATAVPVALLLLTGHLSKDDLNQPRDHG